MKAIRQFVSVALLIRLFKVILAFQCVDEILKYDYSNESY